ncbi:MAG: YnbE family lipoprotein [Proteobacteria bacterium]|nr:YnbE family lipoprotein [Pseudomonadota bacterium]
MRRNSCTPALAVAALLLSELIGCTPTVKLEAPSEPITINLNIKLDADVRLRVEEKAKQDVAGKPIF